jgi:hypothetical protein
MQKEAMIVIVRTLLQLQAAVHGQSQEVFVVGELASAIKRTLESQKDIEAADELHQLINAYDVVDYRNLGHYEGLILSRKLN